MFANMKIGLRLGFGFGLVVVLLIVIATLASMRLAQQNDMLNFMVNDRYPKMAMSEEINTETNNIAIALRNMLLTDKAEDRNKQEENVMNSRKKIKENVEKLEKLLILPKGKELLQRILDEKTKYIAGQNTLIKLINDGKADESQAYMTTTLRPILGAYQSSLKNLKDFQMELVQVSVKEAAESYNNARNLMMVLAAIALAMAAGIAFWVTRSITRPLNLAVDVANQLAEGNLTVKIEVTSKDETGQLLVAMQNMVGKLSQVVTEVR